MDMRKHIMMFPPSPPKARPYRRILDEVLSPSTNHLGIIFFFFFTIRICNLQELSSMEAPTIEVDLGLAKIEEEKVGPVFHCDLYDTELVHKVAEALLPGLATSCVDNTAGGLFNTPGSVAADLRNEMIEYLNKRSESFVAELVVLEGGPDSELLGNPFEIISVFVDDFTIEKRNLFSRFSGWLLSEKREDRIDDFVQEIEKNGFWTLERRQAVAGTLVKNVDFKNSFHCDLKFNSLEELSNHAHNCGFSPIICHNLGCEARFCASHSENHDSECPFKTVPCEQKCPELIMRREMDRHCITKCPMKLVNCPFYAVGCRTPIAQCLVGKHRSEELHSHVFYVLKGTYKEASEEDLKPRVKQLMLASSNSRLADAQDVRFLTSVVKDLDSKLEPLVITVKTEDDVENNTGNGDSNIKEENGQQSIQTSSKENLLNESGVTVEMKNDAVNQDSNIKETDNATATDTQMSREENSSNKTEVTVETKKDAVDEDSNKETDNEKNTHMSSGESLSNKVEVTVEMKNDAENDQNNKDSHSKEKDSEQSTQMSGMKNSSDKVAVSAVMNKDSVDDYTDKEDSDINKGSGKSIETSKEANSSNEAEVNNVSTAQVGNKDKDVADGSLKPEENVDSTKTT